MRQKTPEELLQVPARPPQRGWMDPSIDFEARRGSWSYPAAAKNLRYLGLPNPREWSPTDADWKLPENWQQIILDGLQERLEKYRSLRLFMDICVRCGACADKCHFFIGSGDPKNMPVLRAELLRSVYRNDFTTTGKILGSIAGARALTEDVLKEWFYYFYPVHRVPALLGLLPVRHRHRRDHDDGPRAAQPGRLNINWMIEPVANCYRTGNHLGIQPHTFKDNIEFLCDDLAGHHRHPRRALDQPQGRRDPLRHPVGRLLRRPRHLHLHGLPAALPRARARLHALGTTPPRAATSASSPRTR